MLENWRTFCGPPLCNPSFYINKPVFILSTIRLIQVSKEKTFFVILTTYLKHLVLMMA